MDPELKRLLQQNLEVSEQSFKLVKKLHRAQVRRGLFALVKWAIIVTLLVLGFREIQPYIGSIVTTYEQATRILEEAGNIIPR